MQKNSKYVAEISVSSTLKSSMDNDGTSKKGCLDLALEGERRCRAGDSRGGVAYLESALAAGTDDLRTLSAIYSQLGNAYFYLGDYTKAVEYHRHDLTLARTIGDRMGEAKASGNLGNTLKVLCKFDEAVACCQRHLDISREQQDRLGEGRALYNLGNCYHAKGKHLGRIGMGDPGDFPLDVRTALLKAVEYYEDNLSIVKEIGDRAAQGRACGNLGNTLYLLGDFKRAVYYHQLRLQIAKEFGDKPAMRRAYSNLGNAHVFLGEFEVAVDYYRQALNIAIDLGDRATEAQACYSLGNTCTLLGEHQQAADYHLKHLTIARELRDSVGQARASWSLGNAYMSLGDYSKALYFVTVHYYLSQEIGDLNGLSTARQNLGDLERMVGPNAVADSSADPEPLPIARLKATALQHGDYADVGIRRQRLSMDRLEQISPQRPGSLNSALAGGDTHSLDQIRLHLHGAGVEPGDEESFLEFLMRSQSKRMDDQRCDPRAIAADKENRPRVRATDAVRAATDEPTVSEHAVPTGSSAEAARHRQHAPKATGSDAEFLDLIVGIQGRRMNDQRAEVAFLPGLQNPQRVLAKFQEQGASSVVGQSAATNGGLRKESGQRLPDDEFFETLLRCQNTRFEEQRSELGPSSAPSVTVPPDDDFFQLILKMQAGRIDEQRTPFPNSTVPTVVDTVQTGSSARSTPGEKEKVSHKRTASEKIKKK